MQPILIFDIETVADVEGYRRIHSLPEQVNAQEIVKIMQNERLAETGSTFFRHHLHKIACISLLLAQDETLKLWTLGRSNESEFDIVSRFFAGVEKFAPTLVSWNGSGFDLPVLHYRGLIHGVSAPRYFEIGDEDRDYRYNNYLGRFHWRHIDVMDILSGYQINARASLNDIAKLCGLPGKLDTDGAQVQDMWQAGRKVDICNYCETDVLNTYGIFLRFELLRGQITQEVYQQRLTQLREYLVEKSTRAKHIQEFLAAWQ